MTASRVRAGSPGVTCQEMVVCTTDFSPRIVVAGQTDGQFDQLGGSGRRSSVAGDLGGRVQGGDGLRALQRVCQGQVAGAQLGLGDEFGQTAMHFATATRRRCAVDAVRQNGMGESELAAVDSHHRLDFGLTERLHHLIRHQVGGLRHHRHRGIRETGDGKQNVFGSDWIDPCADQVVRLPGRPNSGSSGPFRPSSRVNCRCKKRVARRDLVNAQQRGPRHRLAQPHQENLMQLAHGQGLHSDMTHAVGAR